MALADRTSYLPSPAYVGGCSCGAVRYEAVGPAFEECICHCSMCRRAAGAPFVSWFTIKLNDFCVTRGTLTRYKSSTKGTRGFCGTCGTQICFHGADTTETIDITSASLDDPECLPPRSHTYFQNRVRWVCVDDGLPRHDQELPR